MKTLGMVLLVALVFVSGARSQFKSQMENSSNAVVGSPTSSISSFFGILDPQNFQMRHNFSLGYIGGSGYGMSLASYTNSMMYKIADPLNVRLDLTLQGSPFGSSGLAQQTDLSRLFISRAELNYRPSDNTFIQLQFSQLPYNRYWLDRLTPSSSLFGDR